MKLFWFICLFASLCHHLSSQTVEDCIKNVYDNVIHNPNFNLCLQAEQSVLKSCKYQGNQDNENDSQYDSNEFTAFDNYNEFIKSTPSPDSDDSTSTSYGIIEQIKQITQWLVDASMRDIISFETRFGYAVLKDTSAAINEQSMNNNANNLSFLKEQISFNGKQFIKYFQSQMDGINEDQLWSDSYNFANKQFQLIHLEQLLETYESFGAGIGFGIQIFCKQGTNEPFLIWNGGAGGGGGYNRQENPAFQYGGEGGIQLNDESVSVGGGTVYEHPDDWIIDEDAEVSAFYDIELPKFEQMLKDKDQCDEFIVHSGGGSGGGFTKHVQDSNLFGFTYYSLNFVLGNDAIQKSGENIVEDAGIEIISKNNIKENMQVVQGNQKIETKGNTVYSPMKVSIIACVLSILVVTMLKLLCLDSAKNEKNKIGNAESDDELGSNVEYPKTLLQSDDRTEIVFKCIEREE